MALLEIIFYFSKQKKNRANPKKKKGLKRENEET
jgi:hypothetical protein